MDLSQFTQIGLPLSLALIMLSLGMKIRLADFQWLLTSPRATVVGLAAQLLLVPLLGYIVVAVFDLPPLLAVGLLILSFCPGGVTSNWFSDYARGNLPLSISLTVIASLITPFTIPLLTQLALQTQLGDGQQVNIPLAQTMGRLFAVTVMPVVLGMFLRGRFNTFTLRWQGWVYRIATVLFLLVILGFIVQLWTELPTYLHQAGLAIIAMITIAMTLGALLARLMNLPADARRTIGIETAMQNGGMALIVTQGVLQNPTMSLIPVLYGLVMLLPIYAYSRWVRSTDTLVTT